MKSWKTTLIGALALVVSILAAAGVFTPEQAAEANASLTQLVEYGAGFVGIVISLIGFFARDNDVTSRQAGAE